MIPYFIRWFLNLQYIGARKQQQQQQQQQHNTDIILCKTITATTNISFWSEWTKAFLSVFINCQAKPFSAINLSLRCLRVMNRLCVHSKHTDRCYSPNSVRVHGDVTLKCVARK
jgi:hypothetical protein